MVEKHIFLERGRTVVAKARNALADLSDLLGGDYLQACAMIQSCTANIMTMGVGKSGFIAKKMAASFASLGQPAFFVHPVDAAHGDLGNITQHDVVVVFSHSGETKELLHIMHAIKQRAAYVIAICAHTSCTLAKHVDLCLSTGKTEESCYLGLAPTTSTTVAMVLADCLVCAVAQARGVAQEDFARTHPAGRLGQLTTKMVADVMLTLEDCPVVPADGCVLDSLVAMAAKSCPVALVVDPRTQIYLGIQPSTVVQQAMAVDRTLTEVKNAAYLITDVPKLAPSICLKDAHHLLDNLVDHNIDFAPVIDEDGCLLGLFRR